MAHQSWLYFPKLCRRLSFSDFYNQQFHIETNVNYLCAFPVSIEIMLFSCRTLNNFKKLAINHNCHM